MRNPKFIKGLFILPLYPILYYCWVEQMKNSWVICWAYIFYR